MTEEEVHKSNASLKGGYYYSIFVIITSHKYKNIKHTYFAIHFTLMLIFQGQSELTSGTKET